LETRAIGSNKSRVSLITSHPKSERTLRDMNPIEPDMDLMNATLSRDKSENGRLLINRGDETVILHSLRTDHFPVEMTSSPVVVDHHRYGEPDMESTFRGDRPQSDLFGLLHLGHDIHFERRVRDVLFVKFDPHAILPWFRHFICYVTRAVLSVLEVNFRFTRAFDGQ
jgi:hypothetical protein